MLKKIAGILCALISVFLVYASTNSLGEPIRKYVELFHPANVWELLGPFVELVPFAILALFLKSRKSKADISGLVYVLFIQISFLMAILYSGQASVKVNLFQFLALGSMPKISPRVAAITVLWLSNGIVMLSIALSLGKDKPLAKRLRGFRWLLLLAALSWISVSAFAFYNIFYAFAIALLGGFFILDNQDEREKTARVEAEKAEAAEKAKLESALKDFKETAK